MLLSVARSRGADVFHTEARREMGMIQGQLSLPLRLLVGSHEPRRQHDDESDACSRVHLSANGWSSCRVPPFPLSARRQSKALVDGGSDLVFDSISFHGYQQSLEWTSQGDRCNAQASAIA